MWLSHLGRDVGGGGDDRGRHGKLHAVGFREIGHGPTGDDVAAGIDLGDAVEADVDVADALIRAVEEDAQVRLVADGSHAQQAVVGRKRRVGLRRSETLQQVLKPGVERSVE